MKQANSIFLFRDLAAGNAEAALASIPRGLSYFGRQAVASALMFLLLPLSVGDLFAQDAPPPPPDYGGQGYGPPQGSYQALPPEELNRLVAPIALYPDSLVAQVLAAATYPAQLSSAEQFVQQSAGAPPEQLADMANQQPWDPSVKALTAFPQVLDNLNRNMDWTTQLGNAYYNQPQDVMAAVQAMRQRAYEAGNLRPTPQLNVAYQPGEIVIQPVNPTVVYLPYYDPWVVYGAPVDPWGGYYYHRPSGLAFGVGLAIGFGVGIGIGAFTHFGWGYHNWAPDWHSRTVIYNHNTYISNSVTVVNHGNYGGFDRNPQARAFNHTQSVQFANVNHTTINNVQVNRTNVNNNINNNTANRGSFNNNGNNRAGAPNGQPTAGQRNFNQGAQPGQFNNAARPGQQGQFNAGSRPGQFNNQLAQPNSARPGAYNNQLNNEARPAQPGQFNSARPALPTAQPGQFNSARPALPTPQPGQFNSARPAQLTAQPGQFNNSARPAPPTAQASQFNNGARPAYNPQQQRAPQPNYSARPQSNPAARPPAQQSRPAAQPKPSPNHESHGGGEHHDHDHR